MKSIFLITGFFLFSLVTIAQNQVGNPSRYEPATLLAGGGRPTGVFFAPSARFTEVNDLASVLAGGQLAMVLGHQFNIGLAVYAMLSENRTATPYFGIPHYLEMGYAGVLLEPVFFDRSVVHFTAPMIVGIGAGSTNYYRIWESEYYDYSNHQSDIFFVAEPGLNAELNVARPFRVFAGASYRFVVDSDLLPDSDARLSGISINFGIKLGWF